MTCVNLVRRNVLLQFAYFPVELQKTFLQVIKTTISPGNTQNMYLEQELELARVYPLFTTPLEVFKSRGAFAR